MAGTPARRTVQLADSHNFVGRDRTLQSPFQWTRCRECYVDYVCLAPTIEWMLATYQTSGQTEFVLDDDASQTAVQLWHEFLDTSTDKKLSVVDIGSGRGHFLLKLKAAGHKVLGLEPNPALRKSSKLSATELQDPQIFYQSTVEEKFDVISLQLSLEHLQEPMKDLKALTARLNPGGRVFLMYHDGTGIPHQILGADSPLWDIQHLQILNPDAAEIFFHRLGMKVVTDHSYWNSYPLSYWGRLLGMPLQDNSVFGKFKLKIPAGNRVLVAQRA
jgi:SAM-dependent methyltransferase